MRFKWHCRPRLERDFQKSALEWFQWGILEGKALIGPVLGITTCSHDGQTKSQQHEYETKDDSHVREPILCSSTRTHHNNTHLNTTRQSLSLPFFLLSCVFQGCYEKTDGSGPSRCHQFASLLLDTGQRWDRTAQCPDSRPTQAVIFYLINARSSTYRSSRKRRWPSNPPTSCSCGGSRRGTGPGSGSRRTEPR